MAKGMPGDGRNGGRGEEGKGEKGVGRKTHLAPGTGVSFSLPVSPSPPPPFSPLPPPASRVS